MREKLWNFYADKPALRTALSSGLGISDILSRILINRGIESLEESQVFLQPKLRDLHDPFLLYGMEAAVSLIKKAVASKKKFLIYGDFDVDGVSSTCLLVQFFKLLNVPVDYYIPNRIREGYSISQQGIEAIQQKQVDLVITVDSGISSLDEIKTLRQMGVDVIVTDHHVPPEHLPPANAIIDPKLKDCTYPFSNLAGVGVAFKLAWGVAQGLSRSKTKVAPEFRNFLLDALAWAAMGTITDLVPLVDENRIISKFGLSAIRNTANPGLTALLQVCKNRGTPISSEDISFGLGPRINAAGRLGEADKALNLFLTDSEEEALQYASVLDSFNRDRQMIEKEIFLAARKQVDRREQGILVMADDTWHPGVIGIVASRLVDEFARPTILVAMGRKTGRGSCRSLSGIDIYNALSHCSDLLETFGGHSLAGGFLIRKDKLKPFRNKISKYISENTDLENMQQTLNIDGEIYLSSLTRKLLSEIDMLNPFGESNPVPVFVSHGLETASQPQLVGRDKNHLTFHVRQGNSRFKVIVFGGSSYFEKVVTADNLTLAFTPKLNTFNGRTAIELDVKDIKVESGRETGHPHSE